MSGRKPHSSLTRRGARRVPEITVYFWVIKALSTAMGEATSDFSVHRLNPKLAVVLGFVGFVLALWLQFSMRRYLAWTYWLAVVMVGVFGTMAADVLHVGFGVPYTVSTALYVAVLFSVFLTWQRTEKTLSIHSVDTAHRESFYWAAVVATFAMGTTLGDLTATTFHFGYLDSGLLFAVVIAIPAVGYRCCTGTRSSRSGSRKSPRGHSARPSPTGWASRRVSAAFDGRRDRSARADDRDPLPRRLPRHHAPGRAAAATCAPSPRRHTWSRRWPRCPPKSCRGTSETRRSALRMAVPRQVDREIAVQIADSVTILRSGSGFRVAALVRVRAPESAAEPNVVAVEIAVGDESDILGERVNAILLRVRDPHLELPWQVGVAIEIVLDLLSRDTAHSSSMKFYHTLAMST